MPLPSTKPNGMPELVGRHFSGVHWNSLLFRKNFKIEANFGMCHDGPIHT
jgi:hypothetical protein